MQTKYFSASTNNYERTRSGEPIDLILLHWSAGESLAQTDAKFTDPNRLASAHLAIENHEIHQYVKDEGVAFHAGSASVDKRSIGIICIGGPNMPFSEATYQTLALVLEELCRKYRLPIDPDHIKPHRSVSKGYCPGPLDLGRAIKEAKDLSPQTVLDKLRTQVEELQDQVADAGKKVATADARIEEVRILLREKDEQLQKKIEDYIFLSMKNSRLEEVIQANKKVFDGLAAEINGLEKYGSRPIIAIVWDRLRAHFKTP